MTRDDDIFADALELPPGQRAAFVARACGDDAEQLARVNALLAAHIEAEAYFERRGAAPLRPPAPAAEKPGDAIGRYVLREKIGEGGCGIVYLADQTEPVRRRVALKVIKLGMDTRAVIARFEAERQALAMMDHPDIARVFDAGATASGRPYFVMEYVDGVPITQFCDEQGLNVSGRLGLFTRACLALQHAHQKGVIHRDVKPSNVLVGLHDGEPVLKVIDFGIAKATQGRLTDETLFTGFDQLIGTPAYMSPEQAELRDLDLDTRTDVYSLGVLLYELLVGRPPFDPKALVRAGVGEIRRIIREVDPPRPSTCVATLGEADRATAARVRDAAPAQLSSFLRGDLDWIVMRCLEKDRARRYGTAHELADDIRRHLRSEPIAAHPPRLLYRTGKFAARHRLACASAAALVASLALGSAVSVRQAVRATRAEQDARRRQDQAETLLAFMLGDFRAELQKLGKLGLLDAVGEKARAYFAELEPRDLSDAALNRHVKALTQIGENRMDQAKYAEAIAAFSAAHERAVALARRHPADPDVLFERGRAEYAQGYAALRQRDFAPAATWFARYRETAQSLLPLEAGAARARREVAYAEQALAILELEKSDLGAARARFLAERTTLDELLAAAPADRSLRFDRTVTDSWLGVIAERAGDFSEAIERFTRRESELDALLQLEPDNAPWRVKHAESLYHRGLMLALSGRRTEAATTLDRALRISEDFVAHDPQNRVWKVQAAAAGLLRATLALADGEAETARRLADTARGQIEGVVAERRSSPTYIGVLAGAWRLEAQLRLEASSPEAASAAARAIELIAPLRNAQTGSDRVLRATLADARIVAGRIALAAGDAAEARRQWLLVIEDLLPVATASSDWRYLDPVVRALALLGRAEESRALADRLASNGYRPLEPWPAAASR